MKISKLFHWLYAIVMLLPIFAIGVTCSYAMFNKNAYQSYESSSKFENSLTLNQALNDINTTTTTYIVSSNTFYSYDNSLIQNNYKSNNFVTTSTTNGRYVLNVDNLKIDNTSYPNAKSIMLTLGYPEWRIYTYDTSFNSSTMYISNSDNGQMYTQDGITIQRSLDKRYNNISVKLEFDIISSHCYITSNSQSRKNTAFDTLISLIFQTDFKLSSVFYDSINKVQQSPLFNWAENSFLVTPFAYIVSLFSMPTNSPIVMFLSYWLAISIIWLVFDLIMYVPLLVHRWLDKGVLE